MSIITAIKDFAEGFARGLGIYLTDHYDPQDVRYTGAYATHRHHG